MIVDKVGINEDAWKGKSFAEFKKAFKGKLLASKIKEAYDKLPKVETKPEKIVPIKEVDKKESK